MPWITRGLREGIVTTGYPRRPDDYGVGFRASVTVRADVHAESLPTPVKEVVAACPTHAIVFEEQTFRLDRGRCIGCGRCVELDPRRFNYESRTEVATTRRDLLVALPGVETSEGLDETRSELAQRVRAFRRSVHIRHVDCGSDGSEEWEIAALTNPVYDVQRLGIFFTASPRHADILLVTGAGSIAMLDSLATTHQSMPTPTVVVAVGTDAISGGLYEASYATRAGVTGEVAVDIFVPGSPPSPFAILHGILLGMGLLPRRTRR